MPSRPPNRKPAVAVGVRLPVPTLRLVERAARKTKQTRSAFIAAATEEVALAVLERQREAAPDVARLRAA